MDQDFRRPERLNEVPIRGIEPNSASKQSLKTAEVVIEDKANNTSDTTARLVVLFAGLSTLCSSSYLAGRVLYRLLVEKDTSFLFFDLSSFDLYVVISLAMFALLYFLSARRVEKATQTSNTVTSIWQALLIVILVGSIVSLIYSPVSAAIGLEWNGDKNTGSVIAYEMLSALFVTVLSGILLFRERLHSKNRSTLLPMIISLILVVAVLIPAVIFILQPKEQKQNDSYYNTQSMYQNEENPSDYSEDSTAMSNAASVTKKAEAYNTVNGEYPATIADFEKTAESKLDSNYHVIVAEPLISSQIQYKRCTATSAQVTYYVTSTNTTKITALGTASSSTAC